jgi:hypothetical protein
MSLVLQGIRSAVAVLRDWTFSLYSSSATTGVARINP